MLTIHTMLWDPLQNLRGKPPFTPYSGFTPGIPVFTHYTSARLMKIGEDDKYDN